MLFSETERRELAAFFAKRFSDPTVRVMLAKRAGVKAEADESWNALIEHAQRRRKLDKLALVASKMDQSDDNLQAVCNLLGARARATRTRAMAVCTAAAVALGFGLGGWMLGSEEAPVTASVLTEAPALALAATAPVPEPEPTPLVAPQPEPEAAPVKKLTAWEARKLARAEARKNRPPTGPAWRNGRCTYDKPGQFIGYWYGGKDFTAGPGHQVNVEIAVNVRKDYPNGTNGFNKQAPVRCILRRGDTVKLTGEAIPVGNGHYWVPLYHGDLVAESPEEVASL